MITTGSVVSIVAVLACLLLVSRNSGFRTMGSARVIRLALIWAAIILGLVIIIDIAGLELAGR